MAALTKRRGSNSKFILYLPYMDANKVLSGDISLEDFLKFLEQLDMALEMKGSALVHCLQGANRSAFVMVSYLTGKCQVPWTAAWAYLKRLRCVCDISEPAPDGNVLPTEYLMSTESRIHDFSVHAGCCACPPRWILTCTSIVARPTPGWLITRTVRHLRPSGK